ncbi:MAG: DUF456 domain-containing protein [Tenuifilaceae bacterium]|jgi:uncharacterized protein YqgC (DUF456 family)|uniref:DUF456 domain-containing protein n=1 Tax=Perlabentimonas gracilis TaxID=2715279 RepID=UPI00140E351F|nr:DUF456 domain-containing protein [Perlabentimonas gracilis]MDX9771772.1 DUF456 domain-containing protein [Tenuifilaceae bacterium]NHB67753.1 DUF456 domain-containing protein [Perlabentimonas gracilis]
MDYILIIVAAILIVLGLLGCILPVIPGPPLSFGGLLILHFTRWGAINSDLLLWLGIAAAVATALDYVFPIWATKRFGGSKRGVWGSTIGLVVGLFLFPPFGIIIGPFVGAFIGEVTANQNQRSALKSAFGSFVGFLLGTGLKFAVSGVTTYYFVKELFLR